MNPKHSFLNLMTSPGRAPRLLVACAVLLAALGIFLPLANAATSEASNNAASKFSPVPPDLTKPGREASPKPPLSSPAPTTAATTNDPSITPPQPANMDTLDDLYRLAIGDRLSFRILEDEEDPKSLILADSGELEVPYIGRFDAQAKTCKQLAAELKVALEKEYYYQATVILAVDTMTRSRGKIYLVGPVRNPGAQEIPSDEVLTLSKAIMRAGGFNDFADKRNVKVTRKTGPGTSGSKTFVVDVGQILEKGKTEGDIALEPGDLVLIPERMIRF